MEIELRWEMDVDTVVAAAALFDNAPRPEWVERFFAEPTHHLCMAFVDGVAVGFVSGVLTTHPDKGTEMFLYELSVLEPARRKGVGRALVSALAGKARELGCYDMWVLTDADNDAAVATYRSTGADPPSEHVMFTWEFGSVASG